jgi:hypothetical protein
MQQRSSSLTSRLGKPSAWDSGWQFGGGLFFVALVGVPGDGGARAFLDVGAGDAGFKLVRIASGKFDFAALDFPDFAED